MNTIAVNEGERTGKKDYYGKKNLEIIISGGGTGGHIFPAVSIANAIIELRPDAKILFVGAEGRMEMQRVPDAGYKIIGLPIAGFDRKHLWQKRIRTDQTGTQPVESTQHHQKLPPASSGRRRRIRQRTDTQNCRNDGSADSDSGTELVCRSHE